MVPRALLGLLLATGLAKGEELFNDKVAVLDPFPREVARGKALVLTGSVTGSFHGPELILIAPGGKTYLNKDQDINGQAFTFTVRFEEGVGPYRLELIARTTEATRSAARFTIWHGQPVPPGEEPEPAGAREPPPGGWPKTPFTIGEPLLEKRFFLLLNDFRKRIGCDPVGWNEAVAARAREHADRMANVERRQHRFGKDSVPEMLKRDGAGPSGLSGPADPWGNTDSFRPFLRPAAGPPGPRVWNRVVVQIVAGDSLEELFERHFVREAAFRICAADPNCLELAVGVARTPGPKPVPGKPPPSNATKIFYCVCFVQVNEKPVIQRQDRAFEAILKRAREREPEVLRALGKWGRTDAMDLLRKAMEDPRPEIVSAAFDGLLLLDEAGTRAEFSRRTEPGRMALGDGRYAEMVALFEPYRFVLCDKAIARAHDDAASEARTAALRELSSIAGKPPEERARAIEDLKRRVRGLGIDEQIEKVLAKS